jgi:hypothetical protein
MSDHTDPRQTPTNVIEALAAVQADMGGIPKMTAADRQRRGMATEGGIAYAYRGIDQIAAAAQPLFGHHGIVIMPDVTEHVVDKIVKGRATKEDTPWTRTTVTVQWWIFGPGGIGDNITCRTIGVADDNADKGMNKAMTTAFKNLLLRLLCIGDPSDDTDGTSTHTDDHTTPEPDPDVVAVWDLVTAQAGTPIADALRDFAHRSERRLTQQAFATDPAWRNGVRQFITDRLQAPTRLVERLSMLKGTPLAESVRALADTEQKKLNAAAFADDPTWAQMVTELLEAFAEPDGTVATDPTPTNDTEDAEEPF